MLVSNHVMKMPCLGQIIQAMNHVVVPFRKIGSELELGEEAMETDKELMVKRMQVLEDHVAEGGMVAWFPEGLLNKGDPQHLNMFRAGGFVIPVNLDVEVWCFASVGVQECWPVKAALGGRPANIMCRLSQLCESSHACLATASSFNTMADQHARCVYLANLAHDRTQEMINEMVVAWRVLRGRPLPMSDCQ